MLRRATALEFPGAESGFFLRELNARRSAARAPKVAEPAPGNGVGGRLDEIERLVALHDKGGLTDAEFAAEKAHLVATPGS
jgi:hypothetical protein